MYFQQRKRRYSDPIICAQISKEMHTSVVFLPIGSAAPEATSSPSSEPVQETACELVTLVEPVQDDFASDFTLSVYQEEWAALFRRNWDRSPCLGWRDRWETSFEMNGIPFSTMLLFFGDAHERRTSRRPRGGKGDQKHPSFQWYFIPASTFPHLCAVIGGAENLHRKHYNPDGTLWQDVNVLMVALKYNEYSGCLTVHMRSERRDRYGAIMGPRANRCSFVFRSYTFQKTFWTVAGAKMDGTYRWHWEGKINPSDSLERHSCPHCDHTTKKHQWALMQVHIDRCHVFPRRGARAPIRCNACKKASMDPCRSCCWKCRRLGKQDSCELCRELADSALPSGVQARAPPQPPRPVRRVLCPSCRMEFKVFCRACCRQCKKSGKRAGCTECLQPQAAMVASDK